MSDPVIQGWVMDLPYKMQTVMLLALRGCDSAAKNEPGKDCTRALRAVVLKNASNNPAFMRYDMPPLNMDECEGMPVHWMLHLIHAAAVVGYFHPIPQLRQGWHEWYLDAVHKLHLNPETREQVVQRLVGDCGPKIDAAWLREHRYDA